MYCLWRIWLSLQIPLAPEKVLHCTLIAKNMGYSARITFASAGMKHRATQASASITGAARRISMPKKVRQKHRNHRACNVQHERTQMQQHRDRVAAQRIERKLQQVHGLRAGKYSAAAQYRIRTEKIRRPRQTSGACTDRHFHLQTILSPGFNQNCSKRTEVSIAQLNISARILLPGK